MICDTYSIPIYVKGGGALSQPLFAVRKILFYNYINLYGAVYLEWDILLFLCVIIV